MNKPLLGEQIKSFILFALFGALSGWISAIVHDSAWAAVFSSSGDGISLFSLTFATTIFPGIMFGLALLPAFISYSRRFFRLQTLGWIFVPIVAYFLAQILSLVVYALGISSLDLIGGEVGASISFAIEGMIRALLIVIGFHYLHSKVIDSIGVVLGFVVLGGVLGFMGTANFYLYHSPGNHMLILMLWHAGMAGALGACWVKNN